ncbi:2Fe-2S iron-sulfur cluster-binding protein [Nocardia goodfellowii]|uniref:Ferredoxin-NADP reductase n=1 Tax=Nocardia goodfellowii TaxID=882446 RepID=A0ABS4QLL2_9NOCA|nr:2Fe-2S iron-sulfur cluster-binding protein [Nocardia goodfellowii]MBP2191934.1 ferredoxin-NADP reductase [Nocardia goodfellowii]
MARPPSFQRATVTRIIKESADSRTFVLAPHEEPLAYQAGQFCTFRVPVDGKNLYRSYSMSSAPETDGELMTTVKRVPGGQVSNWLHDNVSEGDELDMSRAAGRFCLRPATVPLLGFSGGSGITPVLSLTKSALASTDRRVRLLCADRDQASVIFGATLNDLAERYPGRLEVVRHLDSDRGFLTPELVRAFVGADTHADAYICGPEAFMEMIENALPGPGLVFSERFGAPAPALPSSAPAVAALADSTARPNPAAAPENTSTASSTPIPAAADSATTAELGTVTIILDRKKVSVPRRAGETLLQAARRAGLTPPFSCEQGNCATCMGRLTEGTATMAVNDALTEDEVADGYVLTCQAVPDGPAVTVRYE